MARHIRRNLPNQRVGIGCLSADLLIWVDEAAESRVGRKVQAGVLRVAKFADWLAGTRHRARLTAEGEAKAPRCQPGRSMTAIGKDWATRRQFRHW